MAISGFEAKDDGPDEVFFLVPRQPGGKSPAFVMKLQMFLLVALFGSCWGAVLNTQLAMQVLVGATEIKKEVDSLEEREPVKKVLENPEQLERALATRGITFEEPLTAERLQGTMAKGRGVIDLGSALVLHVVLVFLVLSFYFPFKYVRLVDGAESGDPAVYQAIRKTALSQFAVEGARIYLFLLVWTLGGDLAKTLNFANVFSVALVLDVIILFQLRRPAVRDFYSDYRLVDAGEKCLPPQLGKKFAVMAGVLTLLMCAYTAPKSEGDAAAEDKAADAATPLSKTLEQGIAQALASNQDCSALVERACSGEVELSPELASALQSWREGPGASSELGAKVDQALQQRAKALAEQPVVGDGAVQVAPALTKLLSRDSGFVTVKDASGRVVQFIGGRGEPITLNVVNLSPEEMERAAAVFAGQPFQKGEFQGKGSFNLAFGDDAQGAAAAGRRFMVDVYQLPSLKLSVTSD